MKQVLKKYPIYFYFALCVFLLSVFFRFWQLGKVPVSLYWDEIAMYVDAKTVSQTFKDMHGNSALQAIFPSYGDYKLPMYIWLASLSFSLFGASEWALRLPNALIGVAQGVMIFYLLRLLTKSQLSKRGSYSVALLGMLINAVSPWSVLFSRTGFEGFAGQFLITCAVLCLFLSAKSKQWLIASTFFAIAGVYAYYSVRFVWPVVVLCYWLCSSFSKEDIRAALHLLPIYLLSLVIWGVGMLPIFWSPHYSASQQFRLSTSSLMETGPFNLEANVYREVSGNTFLTRILYRGKVLQLRAIAKNYAKHLDLSYLFVTGDANLRHGTGQHGLFLLFCLPLLISGCLFLLRTRPDYLVFFVAWWLIALLPAAVPTDTPHALRSLNALTPSIIVMSFGIIPLYQIYRSIQSKPARQLIAVASIVILSYQIFIFAVDYFWFYPSRSASEWQQGYKEVVRIIEQDDISRHDAVWFDVSDERFFLWYLGFADLTSEQIQSAMQEQFILKRLGKIEFAHFPWELMPNVARSFVVVSKAGTLQVDPSRREVILDSAGQPKFEIGFYEK
jgi:4-amino-4-deoxy-L-arabinose transferase-like glycosyltransferase